MFTEQNGLSPPSGWQIAGNVLIGPEALCETRGRRAFRVLAPPKRLQIKRHIGLGIAKRFPRGGVAAYSIVAAISMRLPPSNAISMRF